MSKVEIYTKGYCPYCHRAKALLEELNISYTEHKIDQQPELRAEMITRSKGGTTVPQIFIHDQPVGGCDDLFALNAANKLKALFNS